MLESSVVLLSLDLTDCFRLGHVGSVGWRITDDPCWGNVVLMIDGLAAEKIAILVCVWNALCRTRNVVKNELS